MAGLAHFYVGEALSLYGFPDGHPLSIDSQGACWRETRKQGLEKNVRAIAPRIATHDAIGVFHDASHIGAWLA